MVDAPRPRPRGRPHHEVDPSWWPIAEYAAQLRREQPERSWLSIAAELGITERTLQAYRREFERQRAKRG
jgi:hypothetical protein